MCVNHLYVISYDVHVAICTHLSTFNEKPLHFFFACIQNYFKNPYSIIINIIVIYLLYN